MSPPSVVLTIADLTVALNRSKTAVRELIAKGEFPKGIVIAGRQTWMQEDVDWFRLNSLIRGRLEEPEHPQP